MKKIIQRTCIGCNCKKDKRELIRLILDENKNIIIDETGKKEGRGFYICGNDECLSKMIKNKKLDKLMQTNISNDFYDNLQNKLNKKSKEGDGVE